MINNQDLWMLISNTIRLICFTFLAVVFDKWWIVFFVILFWTSRN